MRKIEIQINGKKIKCSPRQNILQVAKDNNIDIPHFCYHEDLPIDANCRTCLVETGGKILTSCTLKAKEGLKVRTNTPKVLKLRHQNLELLLSDHEKSCYNCLHGYFCETRDWMKKYRINGAKYKAFKIHKPIHKLGTAAEFDPNTCISCNKCVEMCQRIGIGFLKLEGKGVESHVTYNRDPYIDCIYCGQCTAHCPVSAIREQSHITRVEKALKDKNKIVIAQMAPSVRVSIGEEFGLKPGVDLTGEMFTALRKIGFDKIFDVNMGADITTWVEAEELAERIKNNGVLPMFTSCCPGWVKYVEFYHPEMISHLTKARSPQIHSGGAYKTWWAEKEDIDPKKIVVVSFMPCTSKKYEAEFKELRIDGMYPVDHVLTTRETAILLRNHKVDLLKCKPGKVDKYGEYSGAAAIYGASGGVMESALRSAYYFLNGKELKDIEFEEVRGMDGVKTATIDMGIKKIKVAVVAMAKNANIIIHKLKKDPHLFDYIEFMACPGGCIGGGGQPIPNTDRIIAERIKALYKIDRKMKIRRAHLNPIVKDFIENYIKKLTPKRRFSILERNYSKKEKFE